MRRFGIVTCILIWASSSIAQSPAKSDALATTLARQAILTMTSATPISDVVINANITSSNSDDADTGTAAFSAKGLLQSRVDLNLSSGTRTETRAAGGGAWKAIGGEATAIATHNCMTDAVWFFPALSSLAQIANPNYVFTYIGLEEHASVNAQHIRVSRVFPQDTSGVLQRLSAMDFYLDVASNLPVAITFQAHPDNDLNVNVITEVRFSDYRAVHGILVPFSFQKMLNGRVILEAKVTSAELNAGLSENVFTLQ